MSHDGVKYTDNEKEAITYISTYSRYWDEPGNEAKFIRFWSSYENINHTPADLVELRKLYPFLVYMTYLSSEHRKNPKALMGALKALGPLPKLQMYARAHDRARLAKMSMEFKSKRWNPYDKRPRLVNIKPSYSKEFKDMLVARDEAGLNIREDIEFKEHWKKRLHDKAVSMLTDAGFYEPITPTGDSWFPAITTTTSTATTPVSPRSTNITTITITPASPRPAKSISSATSANKKVDNNLITKLHDLSLDGDRVTLPPQVQAAAAVSLPSQ